jgi:hypothetical protein
VSPSFVDHALKKLGIDKQSSEGKQVARALMIAHTEFREPFKSTVDELV